jgi:hypothetical protein
MFRGVRDDVRTSIDGATAEELDRRLGSNSVDATHGIAEKYLASAPDDDLTRLVVSPTRNNTHTVEERLTGQLQDSSAHAGQIALIRGL